MAEFIEVPVEREDGSEGLHYVNIEAISYVDFRPDSKGGGSMPTVYLDKGYWFTLSGPKAGEALRLLKVACAGTSKVMLAIVSPGTSSVGHRQHGGSMTNKVEKVAEAVELKPHSFDHIRRTTGLNLTDEQFVAMIEKNRGRFKLVHFVKRDDEGEFILPGRPGLRLRADAR